jgi:hypothetical protein
MKKFTSPTVNIHCIAGSLSQVRYFILPFFIYNSGGTKSLSQHFQYNHDIYPYTIS